MLAILNPLLALVGLEADAIKGRVQRQAIVWGLIGGLVIVAIAFLLVALNSVLTLSYGPVVAPLIIAAAALLVALLVLLVAHLLDDAEARREAQKKRSADATALVTTAAITALPFMLKSPLLKQVGIPAGALLAAAYVLSRPKAHHD